METKYSVRAARAEEIPQLQELIAESVRKLQAEDYTEEQRENALKTVFGVDSQLVADGTYLVVEARSVYDEKDWQSEELREKLREKLRQKMSEEIVASAVALGFGVEVDFRELQSVVVACGGWSKRKTLFGGDKWHGREDSLLDPKVDAAKIRAFFIHPAWARRGIGTLLLDACEQAASEAGFTRFEMGATLTGAKLFGARGYKAIKKIEVSIGDGLTLPVIQMEKNAE
jgi:N-acetylglutamate synthase-like GNAT family acetyltransferase